MTTSSQVFTDAERLLLNRALPTAIRVELGDVIQGLKDDVAATSVGNTGNGTASVSVGGSTAAASIATMASQVWLAPAAAGVAVVAAITDDQPNDIPGPYTSPVIPRGIQVLFGSAWEGGNIVITGTDVADLPLTETISKYGYPGTQLQSTKCFKTITGIAKTAVGAGGVNHTAYVSTGTRLGFSSGASVSAGTASFQTSGSLDYTNDSSAHWTTWGVISGTAPNGSTNYAAAYPVAASHTHGGTGLTATDAGHVHPKV